MSETNFTPPAGADYFAKLAQFPEYAANAAASIAANGELQNNQAKVNFDGMCAKWLDNVLNHGLAAAGPKPIAPNAIVTKTHEDDAGVWVWPEQGGPVGVCPDPDTSNVHPSVGSGKSAPAPDRTDLILALLQQMSAQLAKLAAK